MSKTLLLALLAAFFAPAAIAGSDSVGQWKLGMQAYSFNRFTFYEAVDKTRALGLHFIEAYPGQKLSDEKPNVKFDHNMPSNIRLEVLQKLRQADVRLMNYGVVGLPNNEAECRKVFEFARDMGIETIVSEPPEDAFPLINRLLKEDRFKHLKVAIHNHPKPSHYWNPDTVLKVCEGMVDRIGACADTGHWTRSGVDPVEAIKKLEGRIMSLHLKDLNEFGVRSAHDVIWGNGESKVRQVLAELKKQGFAGVFSIEYEHNWLNSMPEIAGCVSYFDRTSAELGITDWKWIFDGKSLDGWDGDPRLWSVKDGVIHGETTQENPARGNTFIVWEDGKLKDFELKIKFRIQNGNSGVQYRSKLVSKPTDENRWVVGGYQAEVENNPGKVGFLYHEKGRGWLVNVGDLMVIDKDGKKEVVSHVSDVDALKKEGYYKSQDWNEYHIIGRGNHLIHYLNGYKTMELIDNDRVTDPGDPSDRKGAAREGLLALQIHAGPPMVVEFKDIRVKHLEEGKYGDAQLLFDGTKAGLDNWKVKPGSNKWEAGTAAVSKDNPKLLVNKGGKGEMINLAEHHGASRDIRSGDADEFGDCLIELQVMVPQNSNSGIYVMGRYEVQVLDSWNRGPNLGSGDMGAIYGASPPPFNACLAPGQWQSYAIEWKAPDFRGADKTGKAEFVEVALNGWVIHSDLEMPQQTPGGWENNEAAKGPLMFQGNHGPVAYRNIIVTPIK